MNRLIQAKQTTQVGIQFRLAPGQPPEQPTNENLAWTKGVCPNCGYTNADVDSEGVLWCPSCGYSQKGCYT